MNTKDRLLPIQLGLTPEETERWEKYQLELSEAVMAKHGPALVAAIKSGEGAAQSQVSEVEQLRANAVSESALIEQLRARLAESEAGAAALRGAIGMFQAKLREIWGKKDDPYAVAYGWAKISIEEALSTSAGRELLERVAKLEKEREHLLNKLTLFVATNDKVCIENAKLAASLEDAWTERDRLRTELAERDHEDESNLRLLNEAIEVVQERDRLRAQVAKAVEALKLAGSHGFGACTCSRFDHCVVAINEAVDPALAALTGKETP